MELLSSSTKKSYIFLSIFIKNVNKTTICQEYNIVKKNKNKKDKNGNIRRICLRSSKKRLNKKDRICIKHEIYEKRGNV